MGIREDRIELKGTAREKIIAELRDSGGGRAVLTQDGNWEYRSDIPADARSVIDVDHKGRVTESLP